MLNNPFIHARTRSDWAIGIMFAVYSGVLTSLFLVVITQSLK